MAVSTDVCVCGSLPARNARFPRLRPRVAAYLPARSPRVLRHDGAVLRTGSDAVDAAERQLAAALDCRPRDSARAAVALEQVIALCRADERAAGHLDLAELYGLLADECEQLGRVEDALAAMRDALAAGWDGQPDGRCRLAEMLMRAGRIGEAAALWAQVKADTPDDVWLYNNAGIEYAHAGDHATALGWLTDGLDLALTAGDPDDLVDQLAEVRGASLAALGSDPDELQLRADDFLTAERVARERAVEEARRQRPGAVTAGAVSTGRTALGWAWFPVGEYAEAVRRWPDLTEPGGPAEGGRNHADYCRAMQAKLVQAAESGMTGIRIAPIRIAEFMTWCAEHGEDPRQARAGFAAHLAHRRPGELTAWPPGRNRPCWCGSGRKYKKCCAAPDLR
jgi:tetratricopeptide (TPR) repeat protein